ncbi:hypothetical protein HYU18_01160 [Candidatus Woesearchaeota archaeon]|nr:hypothetical protein [Candidatus Woesearchaeota archaeon]
MGVQVQHAGLELYEEGRLKLDTAILGINGSDESTLYFTRRRLQSIDSTEQFNGVKLPQSYKDALGPGLAFVDLVLSRSRLLTMYKDNGPKNILKSIFWLMQVLDFEPQSLRLLPPQMDFVNLTESMPYLSPEQLLWLQNEHFKMQEKANNHRLDREEFEMIQAYSAFQWHHERLIYSPRETRLAKTPEQREEKKKDQVWHLIRARESLAQIIGKGYVTGDQLNAALRAAEELKRPIFPNQEEQIRLEKLVEEDRKNHLQQNTSPVGVGKIAAAAATVPAILFGTTFGIVAFQNNLIPVANLPVIRQGERILLGAQHSTGIEYYVIDAETDKVSFLTHADGVASLSKFSDKVVFVRQGKLTLYDFVKREFATAQNDGLTNPIMVPDGTWVITESRQEAQPNVGLRRVRPRDVYDFNLVRRIKDYHGNMISPDGRYLLIFRSYSPSEERKFFYVTVLDLLEMKPYEGIAVSNRGKQATAISANMLAYVDEDRTRIHLSDLQFKNQRDVYFAGRTDTLGYANEEIEAIKFVDDTHLALLSILSGSKPETMRTVSILNLRTDQLTRLEGSALLDTADADKLLYLCGEPSDICEFKASSGLTKRITLTPDRAESLAIYAQNGEKVYVVSYPAGCGESMCAPFLTAIDLSKGTHKNLKQNETDTNYSLIAPPH